MTDQNTEITAGKAATPAAWKLLLMLVAMNGLAPVSLYILVPALPILAKTLGSDSPGLCQGILPQPEALFGRQL